MDKLRNCAIIFQQLFDIEYKIILGRKNVNTEIILGFNKKDFFHLIGLQKLIDVEFPTKNKEKIYDLILENHITYDLISKSKHFYSNENIKYVGINDRINYFTYIQAVLDSNNFVFKYNINANNWSDIKAEFVFENQDYDRSIYLFIDRDGLTPIRFCRSFFPKGSLDYTKKSTRMTLLYKEKINKRLNENIIQFDRLNK